jgi:hypothetical protein
MVNMPGDSPVSARGRTIAQTDAHGTVATLASMANLDSGSRSMMDAACGMRPQRSNQGVQQRLEATANDAREPVPLQALATARQSSPLPGASLRMSAAAVACMRRMDQGCTAMSAERFEDDRPIERCDLRTLRGRNDP